MINKDEMIQDEAGLMQTCGAKDWWTVLDVDYTLNEGEVGRYWIDCRFKDGERFSDRISFGSREAALEHMLNAIEYGLRNVAN